MKNDQYHAVARKEHRRLKKRRHRYVLTDDILGEVITHLYRKQKPAQAQAYVHGLLEAADQGVHQLVHVSPDQFRRAWALRQKYHDKPDISFVDFTSMVVALDLGIADIFTGDDHFRQVNLGFQLVP